MLCDSPRISIAKSETRHYDSRVNLNRKMRNHVRELQHLGYRVTLEPAA